MAEQRAVPGLTKWTSAGLVLVLAWACEGSSRGDKNQNIEAVIDLDAGDTQHDGGDEDSAHDPATDHADATAEAQTSAAPGEGGARPDDDGSALDAGALRESEDGGATDAAPDAASDTTADAAPEAGADAAADTDEEQDRKLVAKLRECGYVTGPNFQHRPIADDLMRCDARCQLAAPCWAILGIRCGTDDDINLGACLSNCRALAVTDGFDCGLGSPLWKSEVCDGLEFCDNQEDELDCPVYTCANGQVTSAAYARCNGVTDCRDRSDELGCDLACVAPP